ncbi:MAG TPA: MarR family transcriptional regulator [Anaerovoracaceae bacterium]|nr:MarR family transcriptional regulator [Anaerovoracaceae bacterium]
MKNNDDFTIGRSISILFRYGQSFLGRKLEAYNIGRGQHLILLTLLRNGGLRQEDLACGLKIDKGSIAKSIKKLEDAAYVERKTDSDDKRAYKVYLTQKAVDIMPKVKESIRIWEDHLTADFTEDEKTMMTHLLSKMAVKAYELTKQ